MKKALTTVSVFLLVLTQYENALPQAFVCRSTRFENQIDVRSSSSAEYRIAGKEKRIKQVYGNPRAWVLFVWYTAHPSEPMRSIGLPLIFVDFNFSFSAKLGIYPKNILCYYMYG